ncbi:hypothetical protein WA026_009147 [Henosepilachna vigintioctopunctata]|uniref:Uncharacterized protein n=1 Tax=Henosepilachna vigintioctopunctata TaxID=420089 RepID=A0AAW1UZB1_9CUCU
MDWNYLYSVVPEDLNDDEKDQLFNSVTWYDSDAENPNESKWRRFFHELDEIAIKQGEEEARKFESETEIKSPRSRKSSSIEIENLEQRYSELKSKYKKQQRINEKYNQEIEALKKKYKSLEREKNLLEHDLQASKHDGSVSSDVSDTVKDQHKELVENVHNKNKQISDLLQDIEEVEKDNVVLREKLANVRDELAVATSEIQCQTEKLVSLDLQLKDSQETIQRLTVDNELLHEEIEEVTAKKNQAEVHLAEFSEEMNKRVEQWQSTLDQKDAEIAELKAKGINLSRQSSSCSFDAEQSHLAMLQKLLSERDSDLMELQSKLEEAVKEMETSTAMIEDLKREKAELFVRNGELDSVIKELKKQLKMCHERGQKLQEEVEFAEKLAASKNDELKQIMQQLKDDGHLDEARILEQMQEVRALNRLNEKQITNLVKNINKLQENLTKQQRKIPS